jgi:hypothetical protein
VEARLVVCSPSGAECSNWLVWSVARREGFKIAQKQRDYLVMVHDFKQMLPIDGLPRKRPDAVAVYDCRRPPQACQHKIEFR